jgi:hypothetical protein
MKTVRTLYPHLVEVSCRNCKLDCNVCENCEVDVFLECEIVPKECVLRSNVLKKIKVEGRRKEMV